MLHGSAHVGDPKEPKAWKQRMEGWRTGVGRGNGELVLDERTVSAPWDEKVQGLPCDTVTTWRQARGPTSRLPQQQKRLMTTNEATRTR